MTPKLAHRIWAIAARSEAPHIACPAPTQAWTEPVQTLILCLFDPLGIFPALARLTPEQAQYYYLCGYGNWDHADPPEESSGGSFQACFSPEITIPQAIARVRCLGDRLRQYQPQIFLVNTAATWNPALGVQPLSDPQLKEQLSEAMRLGAQRCEARRSQSSTSCPYIPHLDAELLSRQVGPSPQRLAQAEALFQRFEAHTQPFKAEISRSIWTAGPRL
ncbi:MAG: phosphoenolpyruvate carboxykinase (ATP) [Synechococcales cyanobacterium CRU_2_2]|nr:phosphoenolpyruvate carboxykinase (ATP) [Synechococcales cyanobacterium CRU_2_2]